MPDPSSEAVRESLSRIRRCAPLLPPPGDVIVAQLCDEIERLHARTARILPCAVPLEHPRCTECGEAMVQLPYHEQATMYACPHGHQYGVVGPDDKYHELHHRSALHAFIDEHKAVVLLALQFCAHHAYRSTITRGPRTRDYEEDCDSVPHPACFVRDTHVALQCLEKINREAEDGDPYR